jgi:hypothetical protein
MKYAVAMLVLLAAAAIQAADFSGSYIWLGSDSERQGVEKGVAAAADSSSFLIRSVVRSRLTSSSKPYTNIVISVSSNRVQFNRDFSNRPVNGTLSGPPVSWEREDGKVYQVTYALEGDRLLQTFKNEDGLRVNAFSLTPDGTQLKMAVTITASAFKVPLSYVLTFRKAAGTP